jgi:flagellar protein FlbD
MINLTRLNGHALVVNSDLIKCIESSPDTTLTLVTGEKIVVRESCAEVITQAIAYRVRLLGELVTAQANAPAVQAAAIAANAAHTLSSLSENATEEDSLR